MVDWTALVYHWRATRFDAAIVAATALCAVAISIEFCVMVGVFMSFVLTVPRAGRMLLSEFVISPDGMLRERLPEDVPCERVMIFGLEGEFFFGAVSALENHFDRIERRVTDKTRVVVLRLKRVRNPDAVALTELEHFLVRMRERGVHVLMCGVTPHLHGLLMRTGTLERVEQQLFLEQPVRQTSTLLAIRHAYELISERCSHCPHRHAGPRGRALSYEI
jgi:SulP family sulfate permease